jgi:surface antigen
MRGWRGLLSGIVLCGVLMGCATPPGPKTTVGAVGGATAGGLLGAGLSGGDPVLTAASVILGGLFGGMVGDRLDAADRKMAQHAASQALEYAPVGQQIPWHNPDSGHGGWVAPTRTYTRPSQGGGTLQTCREYQTVVPIAGREERAYGVACRDAAGEWRIANR